MRKVSFLHFWLLFVVALANSKTSFAATEQVSQPAKKIKVGVIIPLSGEAASIGDTMRKAISMAQSELSPEKQSQFEFVYEDDRLIPTVTVSAFQKLVAVDKIDLLITASSGTSNAVAPLAEKEKLPMVALASDIKVVQGRNYVVNFWVTPDEEVKLLIDQAVRRGYKTVARVITLVDGAVATKKAFDQYNNGRLQVVLDEEFPSNIKDFKTYLTKLRAKPGVDGVVALLFPGQLGIFAQQARNMNITTPLFGTEFFEDSNEVKSSGGTLIGCWYVNAAEPNNIFLDKFRKAYPDASLFAASNSYDTVLLLAKALEHGTTREEINTFFHTVKNFTGALGTYSASGDNRFTLPAMLKVVTKDGFEPLVE